jgi:hypothetical protein
MGSWGNRQKVLSMMRLRLGMLVCGLALVAALAMGAGLSATNMSDTAASGGERAQGRAGLVLR